MLRKMTGGRKPPGGEKSFDTVPPRNTRSLRLLFPIYSVSFFYLLIWYHPTMPLYTPAREIGGMIKDYIVKEHPRFSIPHPLSPASGGILGFAVDKQVFTGFLDWMERSTLKGCNDYSQGCKPLVKRGAPKGFGVIFAAKQSKNRDKTGEIRQGIKTGSLRRAIFYNPSLLNLF